MKNSQVNTEMAVSLKSRWVRLRATSSRSHIGGVKWAMVWRTLRGHQRGRFVDDSVPCAAVIFGTGRSGQDWCSDVALTVHNAAQAVLSDLPAARQLGQAGRTAVLEHATTDRAAARLIELLNPLIDQK